MQTTQKRREGNIQKNFMQQGVFLEKLIVTHVVIKFPAFYGTERLLPSSYEPISGPRVVSASSWPPLYWAMLVDPF
jgi:hypothetical protein